VRFVGAIAESGANLVDGEVDASLEVDEGVGVPDALSDLFAGNSLTGALRQHDEQGELFRLESHAAPAIAELSIGSVDLEIVETNEARWRVQRGHVQQDLRKYRKYMLRRNATGKKHF
jgi:hypothetical protein